MSPRGRSLGRHRPAGATGLSRIAFASCIGRDFGGRVHRAGGFGEELRGHQSDTPHISAICEKVPIMIAAIYARVSTEDQHCEMQLHDLGEYANRLGWSTVVYLEKESTRKKRPELDRLLVDARQRKFDAVLTWKLDRFGRSLRELDENARLLDSYGIRFLALHSGIDTDQKNPVARLLFNIMGSFAEFERDLIRERTKAGIAQAKRAGKHCGRPRLIFDQAKARQLRDRGLSWREIGKKMGVSHSKVRIALKSS